MTADLNYSLAGQLASLWKSLEEDQTQDRFKLEVWDFENPTGKQELELFLAHSTGGSVTS